MFFKLKYNDTLKDAFDTFRVASCKTCRLPSQIRFKLHAKSFKDTDTPKKLGLLHNTTTEIRGHSSVPGLQCSPCLVYGYPKTNGITVPQPQQFTEEGENEIVSLRVHDETGWETNVKMMNVAPLRFLMETYASKAKRELKFVRFYFDGEALMKTDTPKKLGIEGGEVIEVFMMQIGG